MLVLEIELLTGRYAAKQYDDHTTAEWPPHPARVFSALAAAFFETAARGASGAPERAALEWLATQSAPSIYASAAARRSVLDVYVPTNDKSVDPSVSGIVEELIEAEHAGDIGRARARRRKLDELSRKASQPVTSPGGEMLKRALAVMPTASGRKRPRTFPSVYACDPLVQFIWSQAEPTEGVRAALDSLAARVTRLGHSSSLVRLAWIHTHRAPTWIPDEGGRHVLRWISRGRQLSELEAAYEVHCVHRGMSDYVLPFAPERYRRIDDPASEPVALQSNVFGTDWVVFELVGQLRLPIVRAVDVATALRGAALAHGGSAPPEILSGHGPGRTPSQHPHVAYVALPFVGFPHADGSILAAAAILPKGLAGQERRAVLGALGRIRMLRVPSGIEFTVRRVAEPGPHLRTLDPLLWCAEGIVWGTVTPILLDRYPGNLRSRSAEVARRAEMEAERAIVRACKRIGLPQPRAVSLAAPCFRGSDAAELFRRRDRWGLPPRVRVHALIDFGRLVRGPVLLGAGRYVGLGLCRALAEERRW